MDVKTAREHMEQAERLAAALMRLAAEDLDDRQIYNRWQAAENRWQAAREVYLAALAQEVAS